MDGSVIYKNRDKFEKDLKKRCRENRLSLSGPIQKAILKALSERDETADICLDKIRHYLRLCQQWEWLTTGQYQHAANFVTEMGRLLGGWIKQSTG